MRVTALLLAAGAGRRMGSPKAFLPIDGHTFLDHCLALLSRPGIDSIVVLLGPEGEGHVASLTARAGITPVVNPDRERGMLSSLLLGLAEAERRGAEAVLAHLVDHPLVDPATVDRVVAALAGGALVAVPSHGGRRGHPGGFARPTWDAIRAVPPERGARAILADHPEWVVHVPGDPGCVAGIDTPADYARLVAPRP